MKYVDNVSTNPYYNLAMEEYLLKSDSEEEFFMLWQNEPSVIVGKHQNTLEEINTKYVQEKGIKVVRRISGGGAVYHDLGNLNFSFILKKTPVEFLDFRKYTLPIIEALKKLGIQSELSGRNDITIGGKKISGNAQFIFRDRLLHHGTLLFDTDLDVLQAALNVKADKIVSKGIKSVRSRVTNIKDHLTQEIDVRELKRYIRDSIFEAGGDIEEYRPTREDEERIQDLTDNKYSTWDWNYGQSPPFNFRNAKRFDGGRVEVLLDVKDGIIENCKVYGDFFGVLEPDGFEEAIKGLRYEERQIRDFISKQEVGKIFGGIGAEDLISCFLDY